MKKRIMIDMDDVICEGGFLHLMNEFLGTEYKKEDFVDYYMQNVIPENEREKFLKFYMTKNRYDYDILLPNAKKVIEKLSKEYDVFIGTSFLIPQIVSKSGFVLEQKFDYLIKELPFISPYNIIFLGNKSILNCEIKIDDKLENLDGAEEKLLFKTYHNKDISKEKLELNNVILVDGWLEIEKLLLNE